MDIPYGYCHCGCGSKTPLAFRSRKAWGFVKGEPIPLIIGHRKPGGAAHDPALNELEFDRRYVASMIHKARYRSRLRGTVCTIEASDVHIPLVCPILGIPLKHNSIGKADTSPSLDQIVSGAGYTKGNVQVISQRANRIKNDATPEELLCLAAWVYKTYGGKEASAESPIPSCMPEQHEGELRSWCGEAA